MSETLTLRFEVHEGDVTDQFLWPLGQISLVCVVQASSENGIWTIKEQSNGIVSIAVAETKIEAICEFWKARIGYLARSKADE